HELGHTLGLMHGGPQYILAGSGTSSAALDSVQNCKPNYESVMSYSRQLQTSYLQSNWSLNYSSGTFGALNETALSESTGLAGNSNVLATPPVIVYGYNSAGVYKGKTASTYNTGQTAIAVDWTGDGTIQSGTVSAPIQDLGFTGCNSATALKSPLIKDYNEWF